MPRGEKGEARHEEAGPLPGDGFMGESPAPQRRGPLMLTPLQNSQRRRADQVSQIRIHKQIHADICLATELKTTENCDNIGGHLQAKPEAAVMQGIAQEPAMHAWDACKTSAGRAKSDLSMR